MDLPSFYGKALQVKRLVRRQLANGRDENARGQLGRVEKIEIGRPAVLGDPAAEGWYGTHLGRAVKTGGSPFLPEIGAETRGNAILVPERQFRQLSKTNEELRANERELREHLENVKAIAKRRGALMKRARFIAGECAPGPKAALKSAVADFYAHGIPVSESLKIAAHDLPKGAFGNAEPRLKKLISEFEANEMELAMELRRPDEPVAGLRPKVSRSKGAWFTNRTKWAGDMHSHPAINENDLSWFVPSSIDLHSLIVKPERNPTIVIATPMNIVRRAAAKGKAPNPAELAHHGVIGIKTAATSQNGKVTLVVQPIISETAFNKHAHLFPKAERLPYRRVVVR